MDMRLLYVIVIILILLIFWKRIYAFFLGWKGVFAGKNGNYEQALFYSQKALDYAPNDPRARGVYSLALVNLGRIEEALVSCQKIVDIAPNVHHAWRTRGDVLVKAERYNEAVKSYEKALEISPNDIISRRTLQELREFLEGE